METTEWLAELGRAHGQGAPTLARIVAQLCDDYPQDAKRVYARLRSWGGAQTAKYRLRHKVAALIAREIARRLDISQDDVRPARRELAEGS